MPDDLAIRIVWWPIWFEFPLLSYPFAADAFSCGTLHTPRVGTSLRGEEDEHEAQ